MTAKPHIVLDGHYSFADVAAILDKDPKTIYRWRKMGYLPETKSRRRGGRGYILGRHVLRAFEVLC